MVDADPVELNEFADRASEPLVYLVDVQRRRDDAADLGHDLALRRQRPGLLLALP